MIYKYNKVIIEIGEDFISISDDKSEIARWIEDEWLNEPGIVVSIVNAICVFMLVA